MPENVIREDLAQRMGRSYLNYAMSVITDRALPDVRDGLKPVHRRILYSMYDQGFVPTSSFRKCAATVGDVLGRYHPHGDSSVYEAMVGLAQDFTTRYPLVHGHGNFGSVDGDPAAAYRYTEAKLSRIGYQMLQDIDKNTVAFVPNYDDKEQEPTVLPTLIPCLLMNGTTGIAVGMATNMAPHNLSSLYEAFDYVIDCTLEEKEPDIDHMIDIIKAPDFPTGGIILGLDGVREAYKTGRGRVLIRSKYEVEDHNGKTCIVATELPYRVNKARLIEKIDDLRKSEMTSIKEVRDESDKSGVRVVIELKKDANIQVTINKLLKHTELQTSFSINSLSLVDGEPRTLTLKDLIENFMAHAANVIMRRTEYDLNKAGARLNIVDGIIKALDHIDDVIQIIRQSENAIEALMACNLGFNAEQAKAIDDMKLGKLSHANRLKYEQEQDQLEAEIVKLSAIVSDETELLKTMKHEFADLKSKYGDDRRTTIAEADDCTEEENLIKEEMLIVTLSSDGLIKSVEEKEYKTQNRGTKGAKAINAKEDEVIRFLATVNSKEDILFFTSTGRCHVLKAYKIEKASRTARGKSINNYLNLTESEEIVSMIFTDLKNKDNHILFITRFGIIKRLPLEELSTRLSVTKVVGFKDGDSLVSALIVAPEDQVVITTAYGISIRIAMNTEGPSQIRPMGRAAAGVKGIEFKRDNDYVIDAVIANNNEKLFTISETGLGKKTEFSEYSVQNRGGCGIISHKINDRTGKLVAAMAISDHDELFVATQRGLVIRINADTISTLGRSTAGVKIMNLNEGDRIVSISKGNTEEETVS